MYIDHNSIEYLTLEEMCSANGTSTLRYLRAINKGLSLEEALTLNNAELQPKTFYHTFAQRLQQLRIENDFTQEQLCDVIGAIEHKKIAVCVISSYERSRKAPTLNRMKIIADIFEVSVDYLMGISDNDNRIEPNNRMSSDVFAIRLADLRKTLGYTQKDVVEKLKASHETCELLSDIKLSLYENGKQVPNLPRLISLTKFYNTSLAYLTGQIDNRYNNQ